MSKIACVDPEMQKEIIEQLKHSNKPEHQHFKKALGVCFHLPDDRDDNFPWTMYADFMRETAIAFDAALYIVTDNPRMKQLFRCSMPPYPVFIDTYGETFRTPVVLSRSGDPIQEYEFPERPLLVVGPDSGNWKEAGQIHGKISIQTPGSYSLWSSVAAGIVLNHLMAQRC